MSILDFKSHSEIILPKGKFKMSIMIFSYVTHTRTIFCILFVWRRRDKISKKGEQFLVLRTMSYIFIEWGEEREKTTKERELKTSWRRKIGKTKCFFFKIHLKWNFLYDEKKTMTVLRDSEKVIIFPKQIFYHERYFADGAPLKGLFFEFS